MNAVTIRLLGDISHQAALNLTAPLVRLLDDRRRFRPCSARSSLPEIVMLAYLTNQPAGTTISAATLAGHITEEFPHLGIGHPDQLLVLSNWTGHFYRAWHILLALSLSVTPGFAEFSARETGLAYIMSHPDDFKSHQLAEAIRFFYRHRQLVEAF